MLVEVKGIKKHYEKFDLQCSMEVQEGRITGLIGQNGAGKSTTFKAILNLISTDGGSAIVLGKEAVQLTEDDRRQIGTVLSDSGFSNYLKVKDIVKVMAAFYPKFDQVQFEERCEHFRIPMTEKLKTFSTGMKAKLKVIVALSYKAKLLILDEPTAGLDVIARDEILDMLRDYMMTEGRGILVSSHIATDLEGLCDDIYMIHDGRIILHEDTDTLMNEYGLLKADENQYRELEKTYILKVKKEHYGYCCLTNQKTFYQENYPNLVVEKTGIDEIIQLTVKGESL